MIWRQERLNYKTKEQFQFIDITDDVKRLLQRSKIKTGIINIFTRHTTTALKINEREEGFHHDFKKFMLELLPMSREYRHNDFDIRDKSTMCELDEECRNGHAHCQQMLIGATSESVPIIEGELGLGRWQRIFLIELDKPRDREVIVSIMGE